jgi:transcription termination factor Rho
MYNIEDLNLKLLSELREIAEQMGVKNQKKLAKKELIYKILDQQAIMPEEVVASVAPPAPVQVEAPAPVAVPVAAPVVEAAPAPVAKAPEERRQRHRVKRENVQPVAAPVVPAENGNARANGNAP